MDQSLKKGLKNLRIESVMEFLKIIQPIRILNKDVKTPLN
ncbi:hypothetical protein HPHPP41_1525 [Helicobacter pylori Hp P-41]|nr:hypothetical protein HPHPP41_1525 [Helicobacter pylori Hp P-41]